MNVALLLQQVKEIRQSVQLPILLMGYLNPVLQYGIDKFIQDAAAAGVDGLILPDLPLDEYVDSFKDKLESAGLINTFLISPTTSEDRIRKIDAASTGFIYAVSSSSTTGTRQGFAPEQEAYFQKLADMKLVNPFLIGFGVSNKVAFQTVCKYALGAIVGSAFINLLKNSSTLAKDIKQFITDLK
jgi:tryptophan synthase alpha chain